MSVSLEIDNDKLIAFSDFEVRAPESQPTILELVKKIEALGKLLEENQSTLAAHRVVDLTQIASRVMSSTVQIEMMRTANTLYSENQMQSVGRAHASGFLITPDGYILTNHHVVNGAEKIKVIFGQTGRSFFPQLIGSDPETDIAVLKIEGEDHPYISFANSDQVQVGESAIAIGNPLCFRDVLTFGIVAGRASGLHNALVDSLYTQRDVGVYADYILTDTWGSFGSSGGPILNCDGGLIGIQSKGLDGMAANIASNTVYQVVEELMKNGHVTRSWLGARLWTVDDDLISMLRLENISQPMLIVSDMLKDSPAQLAGLKKGDVILGYNDIPITTDSNFFTDLAMRTKPGSELKLSIIRKGEPMDILVVLGSRLVGVTTPVDRLGICVENLDNEKFYWCDLDSNIQGVLVAEAKVGRTGLRPADVITGVVLELGQEIPVRNVDEFLKVIEEIKDQTVSLVVRSPDQSRQRYLFVHL